MLFDADPETGLAWHQATRIQSLCKAVRQAAREIRRYGQEGITDDGSRCAPLPEATWERLAPPIQELQRVAEAAEARSGGKAAKRGPRPLSATRAAISGRLAMLEELAEDLKPRKFEPSYGALPQPMKEALAETAAAIEELVAQARAALEATADAGAQDRSRGG